MAFSILILLLVMCHTWDEKLFFVLNCTDSGSLVTGFFEAATTFSDGYFLLLVLLLFQPGLRSDLWRLLLIFAFTTLTVQILKSLSMEPRPALVYPSACFAGFPVTTRSYPSGHTTAVITLMAWLWPRIRSASGKFWLVAGVIIAAISRVHVGAHFPRDVAMAAAFAWIFTRLLDQSLPPAPAWNSERAFQMQRLISGIAGALLAASYLWQYTEKSVRLTPALDPLVAGIAIWFVLRAMYSWYLLRAQDLTNL